MTDKTLDIDPNEFSSFEELLRWGADIAGGAIGGAIGLVGGNLPGAIAGGAAGPLIARSLLRVGLDFHRRYLSPREQVRVGAVLALAVNKTSENMMRGKEQNPRLAGTEAKRDSAKELCEALVLAVQRDPQEKKLNLYANLLGNLPFEEEIDVGEAHQLTRIAQELTYRQLCLVAVFADGKFNLRDGQYADYAAMTPSLLSVLVDVCELWREQIVVLRGSRVYITYDLIIPARVQVYGIGGRLYRLMELSTIDSNDLEEVAQFLR
ncbi:MAG: hypothetical protein WCA49_25155 [Candidatus Sulfotelmatobacter sp.]